MAKIMIPIDLLFETAREVAKSRKEMTALKLRLEKKMKLLEKSWSDASSQQFFDYYREVDQQLGATGPILEMIAEQLQAIADRYEKLSK